MSLHTHDNRALFFIGKLYFHPDEIARDPDLPIKRKRALLSDWASDRNAVESKPALRRNPITGAQCSIDEIIRALRSLDNDPDRPPNAASRIGIELTRRAPLGEPFSERKPRQKPAGAY